MCRRRATAKTSDPKRIVEQGYDQIAERYLAWAESDASKTRERYVTLLHRELPRGARVIELGCGAGVPATRMLAQDFEVTGVDLSARQIALARQNVPQARFLQADITQLDLPPESYDGIVALYALFHVPREEQPSLLCSMASWLRPGGLLVATMGTQASEGDVEADWLGAPMYWSSYKSATNVRLVQKAGLEITQAREETVEEHGEQATFLWIVARKPEKDG
jgi:cyclopropane fatty-acyl-phospholipid synthase-like methyltransferase